MFKPGDSGGVAIVTVDNYVRTGMVIPFAGVAAPSGWLLCDGSAVSQITYAALFTICGTAFNTGGEPIGTFRVPNMISRSIMGYGTTAGLTPVARGEQKGEETHILSVAELATHNHGVTDPGHSHAIGPHSHTITDLGHNHTQNAHTHTQNAHNHALTDPGHIHNESAAGAIGGAGAQVNAVSGDGTTNYLPLSVTASAVTGISVNNTTPTNQNTTATNNSAATGISIDNTTATMLSNTTGVTTNNNGSSTGHNTIHPVLGLNHIIKY